jgi:hypothetical protein
MEQIAQWTNKAKESIVLFDDLTYEVLLESGIRKANLAHWYKSPESAVKHIQNDINAGYYPQSLVKVEA